MNNFFTQLKDRARTIRLSHDEKQVMRVQLHTYMEQNPQNNLQGTFAAPAKIFTVTPSPFFFFSPTNLQNLNTKWMVPVALLLVVGLGSGTAFAAQGALPGSPLYAVKININERVAVALATTPAAKAEVQAQLATTRIEEAETLASNGILDATTTAELASNFNAHAKAAQTVTETLATNDPGTAAQLDTDFNSTLSAHGSILAQIGNNSKSDETMQNSNALALQVQQEADKGNHDNADNGTVALAIATDTTNAPAPATPATSQNGSHIRTFAAMAPRTSVATGTASSSATSTLALRPASSTKLAKVALGTSNDDAKVAVSLSTQASTSIAALQQDFAALKQSLGGSASAQQIAAQLAVLQTNYASASAELAAGNPAAAVQDFTGIIRLSVTLDAYLKAGQKFNLHLLSGLLGNSDSNNGSDSQHTTDQNSATQNGGTSSVPVSTSSPNTGEQDGGKGPSDGGDVKAELHL